MGVWLKNIKSENLLLESFDDELTKNMVLLYYALVVKGYTRLSFIMGGLLVRLHVSLRNRLSACEEIYWVRQTSL
jgi:hypothetical protein